MMTTGTARKLRRAAADLATRRAQRDEAICVAYSEGASLREIATEVGVHYVTVRNIVQRSNA